MSDDLTVDELNNSIDDLTSDQLNNSMNVLLRSIDQNNQIEFGVEISYLRHNLSNAMHVDVATNLVDRLFLHNQTQDNMVSLQFFNLLLENFQLDRTSLINLIKNMIVLNIQITLAYHIAFSYMGSNTQVCEQVINLWFLSILYANTITIDEMAIIFDMTPFVQTIEPFEQLNLTNGIEFSIRLYWLSPLTRELTRINLNYPYNDNTVLREIERVDRVRVISKLFELMPPMTIATIETVRYKFRLIEIDDSLVSPSYFDDIPLINWRQIISHRLLYLASFGNVHYLNQLYHRLETVNFSPSDQVEILFMAILSGSPQIVSKILQIFQVSPLNPIDYPSMKIFYNYSNGQSPLDVAMNSYIQNDWLSIYPEFSHIIISDRFNIIIALLEQFPASSLHQILAPYQDSNPDLTNQIEITIRYYQQLLSTDDQIHPPINRQIVYDIPSVRSQRTNHQTTGNPESTPVDQPLTSRRVLAPSRRRNRFRSGVISAPSSPIDGQTITDGMTTPIRTTSIITAGERTQVPLASDNTSETDSDLSDQTDRRNYRHRPIFSSADRNVPNILALDLSDLSSDSEPVFTRVLPRRVFTFYPGDDENRGRPYLATFLEIANQHDTNYQINVNGEFGIDYSGVFRDVVSDFLTYWFPTIDINLDRDIGYRTNIPRFSELNEIDISSYDFGRVIGYLAYLRSINPTIRGVQLNLGIGLNFDAFFYRCFAEQEQQDQLSSLDIYSSSLIPAGQEALRTRISQKLLIRDHPPNPTLFSNIMMMVTENCSSFQHLLMLLKDSPLRSYLMKQLLEQTCLYQDLDPAYQIQLDQFNSTYVNIPNITEKKYWTQLLLIYQYMYYNNTYADFYNGIKTVLREKEIPIQNFQDLVSGDGFNETTLLNEIVRRIEFDLTDEQEPHLEDYSNRLTHALEQLSYLQLRQLIKFWTGSPQLISHLMVDLTTGVYITSSTCFNRLHIPIRLVEFDQQTQLTESLIFSVENAIGTGLS